MNYAVEQRMRFIDFLIDHYGQIGRDQIIDFFGIGEATATRDFRVYEEMAPGNMLFNNSSKKWIKADTFKRIYSS